MWPCARGRSWTCSIEAYVKHQYCNYTQIFSNIWSCLPIRSCELEFSMPALCQTALSAPSSNLVEKLSSASLSSTSTSGYSKSLVGARNLCLQFLSESLWNCLEALYRFSSLGSQASTWYCWTSCNHCIGQRYQLCPASSLCESGTKHGIHVELFVAGEVEG